MPAMRKRKRKRMVQRPWERGRMYLRPDSLQQRKDEGSRAEAQRRRVEEEERIEEEKKRSVGKSGAYLLEWLPGVSEACGDAEKARSREATCHFEVRERYDSRRFPSTPGISCLCFHACQSPPLRASILCVLAASAGGNFRPYFSAASFLRSTRLSQICSSSGGRPVTSTCTRKRSFTISHRLPVLMLVSYCSKPRWPSIVMLFA